MPHDSNHITAELGRRIEAAADAASEWGIVRLLREDAVGGAATAGAVCAGWLALALLDPVAAILTIACAGAAWARLRRLPPPREPDPDDWL